MFLVINIVAISRDDIMCCRNFRRNASGNSRYGCAITLQETVVTTALRLNFEFTPTHKKNGRVSEEAQPTSNQKTIVLQKEFSLIGADCHHPTPAFRLDYISYLAQGRKSISKKRNETSTNRICMIRPSL